MARAAQYFFGDESFTSKEGVRIRAREIWKKHALKVPIPEGTRVYRFVLDLLRVHVESANKIAGGVAALYVDRAPAPNDHTTCFWVRRSNTKPTDFGIESCLRNIYQLNKLSLRQLVQDQIDSYKFSRLRGLTDYFVSDYSGESFPLHEACVDHEPTFEEVLEQFFSHRPEDPKTALLTKATDASSVPVWRDENLASAFRVFHSSCTLRLVTKNENLSRIKKEQNKRRNELSQARLQPVAQI